MKVRCKKIYNIMKKQYVETSASLTIGKEYLVLEINISPGKRIRYRLLDDQESKMSALYDADDFEIVSNKLLSNWKIFQLKSGLITLRPASWSVPGFWEDFYEYNLEAMKIYRRELIAMMQEEDMFPRDHIDNEEEAFKNYKLPRIINLSEYFNLNDPNTKS